MPNSTQNRNYGTDSKPDSSHEGFYAYRSAGFCLQDINFVGVGSTATSKSGVYFYNDQSGNVQLDTISIKNVDVSNFGSTGILIGGWYGAGYKNVTVTNAVVHDIGKNGIFVFGQGLTSHSNVYVGHCTAYRVAGAAGTNSGNGILLNSINHGVVERSLVHDCGGAVNGSSGGSVGIWAYYSNDIAIQHNEVYNQRTGGNADGGGFDFDGGVTNSVLQYNYSHNNDGAGFLICQYSGALQANSNNVVRYNISQNDGRKNGYAGIQFYNAEAANRLTNIEIYNNTIYITPASTGTPRGLWVMSKTINVHLRNNIFQTTGGVAVIDIAAGQTGMLLQGNDYWSTGSALKLKWGGTTYNTLDTFRTATGQEKLNGNAVGFSVDPLLNNPGGGDNVNTPDLLETSLDVYKLSASSPLINQGLDLATLFGIDPGSHDYFGSLLPQGLGFELGAFESA